MEDVGDVPEEVANFQPDTLQQDDDTAKLERVISNSMTVSDEMEMQEVDVTWTKDQNGNESRDIGIVFTDDRSNGLAPINSVSVAAPNGNHLSVEQELANAMGAYGGGSEKQKKKRRKKRPPIQHSTEWAY